MKKIKKSTVENAIEVINDLNLRQERFCQLYATDRQFFGNGVETYIEVYELNKAKPNWYKTACQSASRLLSNVKVCERINELLEEGGLNDQFVDKQLLFLITQHADFNSKSKAISEYNKIKKRVSDKLELNGPVSITMVNYKNSAKGK